MIPKQTIDTIKDAAVIEDVVSDFISLKKRGANYLGNCPFHDEKTPSFTVSPSKGIYKCFGCGASGDSVSFVMEHEHISYPEALRYLAKKYHIEVEEQQPSAQQLMSDSIKEALLAVNQYAENYFVDTLWNSDEGQAIGLSYFRERGFTDEIIKKFKLGYSIDEWKKFTAKAISEGYRLEYLKMLGLTSNEKEVDIYRGRVMFPIHGLTGKVLGFGGRILKTNDKSPKYINSPESEIYVKNKVLYGLFFAKNSIVKNNKCFLVEGYTDVISLHQAGIENVVASSGTSLTTGQIQLIKRYTPNITILYDGDNAGIKASFRGIDMILEEGMNVRVVLFPDGEDPDSFAQKHSTADFSQYITDNEKDFIQFKTSILLKDAQNDPIKKASVIRDVVESIALVPDSFVRASYVQECSSLLNIAEQTIFNELNKIRRQKTKSTAEKITGKEEYIPENPKIIHASQNTFEIDDLASKERELMRVLVNYGSILIDLQQEDGSITAHSVASIIVDDLVNDEISLHNPSLAELFSVIVQFIRDDRDIASLQSYLLNEQSDTIKKLTIDLLASQHELSKNWEEQHRLVTETEDSPRKIHDTISKTLYHFKRAMIHKMIKDIQEKLKTTTSNEEIFTLLTQKKELDEVRKALSEELSVVIWK